MKAVKEVTEEKDAKKKERESRVRMSGYRSRTGNRGRYRDIYGSSSQGGNGYQDDRMHDSAEGM